MQRVQRNVGYTPIDSLAKQSTGWHAHASGVFNSGTKGLPHMRQSWAFAKECIDISIRASRGKVSNAPPTGSLKPPLSGASASGVALTSPSILAAPKIETTGTPDGMNASKDAASPCLEYSNISRIACMCEGLMFRYPSVRRCRTSRPSFAPGSREFVEAHPGARRARSRAHSESQFACQMWSVISLGPRHHHCDYAQDCHCDSHCDNAEPPSTAPINSPQGGPLPRAIKWAT